MRLDLSLFLSLDDTTRERILSAKGTRTGQQLQAMRQWAQENGYEVSNRGRISMKVQDAYHAAH